MILIVREITLLLALLHCYRNKNISPRVDLYINTMPNLILPQNVEKIEYTIKVISALKKAIFI